MPLINQRLAYLLNRCRKDGLRSTLMLIGKNLPQPVLEWQIRRRRLQHERFDAKYHIDTQMPVALADLETTAPGAKFANRYQGSPLAVLHRIIRRLKVDRYDWDHGIPIYLILSPRQLKIGWTPLASFDKEANLATSADFKNLSISGTWPQLLSGCPKFKGCLLPLARIPERKCVTRLVPRSASKAHCHLKNR